MTRRAAPWVTVASLAALVLLTVFLAASLGQVKLTEGSAFDETIGERIPASAYQLSAGPDQPLRTADYILAYGPLGLVVLALLVFIATQLTQPMKPRRRSLPATVLVLFVMVAFALVIRMRMMESAQGIEQAPESKVEQPAPADETTAAPISRAQEVSNTPGGEARATSSLLQLVVGLLALGACTGIVVGALRARPRRFAVPARSEERIRDSVDFALHRLHLGRDAAGVVEECYRDVMRAYAASSGVDPSPLTPREFVRSLEALGLGGAPLEELTSLFELVRYGRRPDDPLAPQAIRCLTELRDSLAAQSAPASA